MACIFLCNISYCGFQDAMRAVTKVAIREARLKEIKTELLNSQKLQVSRKHTHGIT